MDSKHVAKVEWTDPGLRFMEVAHECHELLPGLQLFPFLRKEAPFTKVKQTPGGRSRIRLLLIQLTAEYRSLSQ